MATPRSPRQVGLRAAAPSSLRNSHRRHATPERGRRPRRSGRQLPDATPPSILAPSRHADASEPTSRGGLRRVEQTRSSCGTFVAHRGEKRWSGRASQRQGTRHEAADRERSVRVSVAPAIRLSCAATGTACRPARPGTCRIADEYERITGSRASGFRPVSRSDRVRGLKQPMAGGDDRCGRSCSSPAPSAGGSCIACPS